MAESVYVSRLKGTLLWLSIAVLAAVVVALGPLLIDGSVPSLIAASVFGFGAEIPLETVTGVEVGPVTRGVDGAGPRFIGDASAYIVGGPSVKITTGATSYIISADDPEAVVADIESRRLRARG